MLFRPFWKTLCLIWNCQWEFHITLMNEDQWAFQLHWMFGFSEKWYFRAWISKQVLKQNTEGIFLLYLFHWMQSLSAFLVLCSAMCWWLYWHLHNETFLRVLGTTLNNAGVGINIVVANGEFITKYTVLKLSKKWITHLYKNNCCTYWHI